MKVRKATNGQYYAFSKRSLTNNVFMIKSQVSKNNYQSGYYQIGTLIFDRQDIGRKFMIKIEFIS